MMIADPRVSNRQVSEIRFVYRSEHGYINGVSHWIYTDVAWWEDRDQIDGYADVPNVGEVIVMPGPGGIRRFSLNSGPWQEVPLPTQVPCRIIEHIWWPNDDGSTWTVYILLGALNEDVRGPGTDHCPPVPIEGQEPWGRGTIIPEPRPARD